MSVKPVRLQKNGSVFPPLGSRFKPAYNYFNANIFKYKHVRLPINDTEVREIVK